VSDSQLQGLKCSKTLQIAVTGHVKYVRKTKITSDFVIGKSKNDIKAT